MLMAAGTTEHKEMYDYKLHTGYIGTGAFERFKSHLPGKVCLSHSLDGHCRVALYNLAS